MKLWVARNTNLTDFRFYRLKPEPTLSHNKCAEKGERGFDILYYPQTGDSILCQLYGIEKLFPELSNIQVGECVQVEFNNDCFRILKEPKNES